MLSFSSILIDHRWINGSKKVLELLLATVIPYISASSRNEKILQHSDESDSLRDNQKKKNSPLDDNQLNNVTFIPNHERNRRNL